jgi:formamidopyrimidine-DNA glycosylase
MPEAPQMQALAERVAEWLTGATFEGYDPLGFTGLKTYDPPPEALVGAAVVSVSRRAKYVTLHFDNDLRIMFHLSQAGRLDFEEPPKKTRPKGAVVRWRFSENRAVLLREFGTERKAGWWVLAADDEGPVEKLGPATTVGASTRSCAISARSRESDVVTPTTSCTEPGCRRTRR